jgi:Holliday junction resolvasome RuvABC DNA-binding subunit
MPLDDAGQERARVVLTILNKGNVKQLQSLKGVGKQRAQQLLSGREAALNNICCVSFKFFSHCFHCC